MAKQSRILDAQFPVGGVSKRFAYQSQPDFTTVSAVNVRPEATLEKRLRGGSRPGLAKAFTTQIGSGDPIYMAAIMRSLADEGRKTFTDTFPDLANWSALSTPWVQDNGGLVLGPAGGDGGADGTIRGGGTKDLGSVLDDGLLSGIEDSGGVIQSPYSVSVKVLSVNLRTTGEFHQIWLYSRLDDTTPAETSNVYLKYSANTILSPSVVLLFLGVDGGSEVQIGQQEISNFDELVPKFHLVLTIDGTTATGQLIPGPGSNYDPTLFSGGSITIDPPAANESRVALRCDDRLKIEKEILDNFQVTYFDAAGGIPPESVVCAAKHGGTAGKQGSNVWYENNTGSIVEVTSDRDAAGDEATDLNFGEHLMAVDRLGKLYICDFGVRKEDNDGTLSADGLTFDDAAGTDWSEATATVGVDKDGDWLEILDTGTGGLAVVGVYKIIAASAAGVTVSSAASTGAETVIKYRIVRGPKVFDPSLASGSRLIRWEPTTGSIPLGCTILEVFRDRAVLSGDPEHSGLYYMSRSGDFLDFNYAASVNDRARATSDITTSSDGGQLSIPMSAIVAITEDYALFAAESALFILRGDPTVGGIMANVSNQIGIGSRTASCRIPDGSVVFMSRDGLYRFHPSSPKPVSLSRDKLPQDLIDVVQNTDLTVTLEYDVRFRGVHLYIAPKTAGPITHYWFDWDTQSFWPVTLDDTHDPFSVVYSAKDNHVIFGCRDGYLRRHSSASSTDQMADDTGNTINSHAFYGPFNLGGGGINEGAIQDLYAVLDDQSGDAELDVFVGDDPEDAFKSASTLTKTISAGRSNRMPVRSRGKSAFIRISDSSGSKWAIDSLKLAAQRNGKQR